MEPQARIFWQSEIAGILRAVARASAPALGLPGAYGAGYVDGARATLQAVAEAFDLQLDAGQVPLLERPDCRHCR